MTLLVRDEVDILDAHLAFHLHAGVDVVIVTDHRSTDGTRDLLESYAGEGTVHLIRRDDSQIRQAEWVTHMARLAATEFGADWVINSDADEFWWPRAGSLKRVLAAIPPAFGFVRAVSRTFLPRPGLESFAERMTVRLALAAPINDPTTPFRHVAKVAHRSGPRVVVSPGNHAVSGVSLAEAKGWSPIEVLHFPLRSPAQSARKHETTSTAWAVNLRGDLARAARGVEEGKREAVFDRVMVDDRAYRRGLTEGWLVEDTRLRDALRALRDGSGSYLRRGPNEGLFPSAVPSSVAADTSRAVETAVLMEADAVRLQRRADELAARVARLQAAPK